MKTKLDMLLDQVRRGKRELTLDTEGYSKEQILQIVEAADARGLNASYDGRYVLVREL